MQLQRSAQVHHQVRDTALHHRQGLQNCGGAADQGYCKEVHQGSFHLSSSGSFSFFLLKLPRCPLKSQPVQIDTLPTNLKLFINYVLACQEKNYKKITELFKRNARGVKPRALSVFQQTTFMS